MKTSNLHVDLHTSAVRQNGILWILHNDPLVQIPQETKLMCRAAEQRGYTPEIVSMDELTPLCTSSGPVFVLNGHLVHPMDEPVAVLSRTGAETSERGLSVLAHAEAMGMRLINPLGGIAATRCKLRTASLLAAAGLPIPATMGLGGQLSPSVVSKRVGEPLVAKRTAGTRGSGVIVLSRVSTMEDLLLMVSESLRHSPMIAQEFMQASVMDGAARDLRVVVVGGRVLGTFQRRGQPGSVKANVALGGTLQQVETTSEIEQLAVRSTAALGLDYAGVDLLFANDGFVVNELNSAADFDGLLEASDGKVDVAGSILAHVDQLVGPVNGRIGSQALPTF